MTCNNRLEHQEDETQGNNEEPGHQNTTEGNGMLNPSIMDTLHEEDGREDSAPPVFPRLGLPVSATPSLLSRLTNRGAPQHPQMTREERAHRNRNIIDEALAIVHAEHDDEVDHLHFEIGSHPFIRTVTGRANNDGPPNDGHCSHAPGSP